MPGKARLPGLGICLCAALCLAVAQPARAQISGAIWTTLVDGTEVDANIYQALEDVYLNGGPGMGAGTNSPGLAPDGIYIFMVTDPSGKSLLSTDNAECRQVEVLNGAFAGSVGPGCKHAEGTASVGVPVQLMPYLPTSNNGGEFKVWLTPKDKYACPSLTETCDTGFWGFIERWSKTDNFKVKVPTFNEFDTQFHAPDGRILDGYRVQWVDSLGASNNKWSYGLSNGWHIAHIEAVEEGVHYIILEDQPGCTIGHVVMNGSLLKKFGPQAVAIHVTNGMLNRGNFTVLLDVYCNQ